MGICISPILFILDQYKHYTLFNINPLSPNTDHHKIPPCKIKASKVREVMKIEDMIT